MIRLGCYEFIVCKGNVFKRIRKTKTHACLCCRAAVSFCNVALHLHLVIRLRANWAAVRHSVQAPPPVIPASEPESWAALCGVLRCTAASLLSIPANASQGPVSEHGVTAQTRRLCHRAPLHCCPAPPRCHSGLRAGILGGLMRSIALHCRLHCHSILFTMSFPPPSGNPVGAALCVRIRGHYRDCRCRRRCTQRLYHPRQRLASGSLTRQLGCGSATRASTVALTLHQLCRLGGRHDGAKGTRGERKGGKGRCAFLHCAPHPHTVIPGLTRNPGWPYAWYCLAGVSSSHLPPKASCRSTG